MRDFAVAATRPLDASEQAFIDDARAHAHLLYEGRRTPHRSCGIALAETFGVATAAYQALRRGGITGEGECGAIRAGEQILGELLGDPSPTGAVTEALRAAVGWYQVAWRAQLFGAATRPDVSCNALVRPHGEFTGDARKAHCTSLAATVGALTAEALVRFGARLPTRPPLTLEPA